MKAVVVVPIRGSGMPAKVAEASDPTDQVRAREVTLEIQGGVTDGYHLIMSPAGCFTADHWYGDSCGAPRSRPRRSLV